MAALLHDNPAQGPGCIGVGIQPGIGTQHHRVLLRPESEIEGVKSDDAIRDLLAAVKVPK